MRFISCIVPDISSRLRKITYDMRKSRIANRENPIKNQLMVVRNAQKGAGGTVLELPQLIFGSSALGNLYQELDVPAKRAIVGNWFQKTTPPVCIDSAGKYGAGLALEEIGDALRSLEVSPDDVIISNKLGWKRVPLTAAEPTFEPGVWKNLDHDAVQAINYKGIRDCWKQGNDLLGAPFRAQLLSIHDPDEYLAASVSPAERLKRLDDIREAYRALKELKNEGNATAIGIGSKEWTVIRELVQEVELDWVMLAGSFTIRTHPEDLLHFINELKRSGIYVINSALFNSGFLVGGSYFDYKRVTPESDGELYEWRNRFFEICRQYDVTPADACVEFGFAPDAVGSIAMNTTRPERIAENVESLSKRAPLEFWNRLRGDKIIAVTPEELR